MTVSATLYSWPTANMLLGHVAVEVRDETNEKYYVSYAMGNNYEWDVGMLGIPKSVNLPATQVTMNEFKAKFVNGPYDIQNPNYDSDYKFFTNNCAHGAANVLLMAGYPVEKLVHKFALTPCRVTKEARKIAKNSLTDSSQVNTKVSSTSLHGFFKKQPKDNQRQHKPVINQRLQKSAC